MPKNITTDKARGLLCRLNEATGRIRDRISVFSTQAIHDQINAKVGRIRQAWHHQYPGAAKQVDDALIRTGYVG